LAISFLVEVDIIGMGIILLLYFVGGTKPATLETGAVVTVPSFVNVGDDILVDSRTGQYMNRA
jgi:hypothetical protein